MYVVHDSLSKRGIVTFKIFLKAVSFRIKDSNAKRAKSSNVFIQEASILELKGFCNEI